jgi:hypothetical protein
MGRDALIRDDLTDKMANGHLILGGIAKDTNIYLVTKSLPLKEIRFLYESPELI